MSAFNEANQVRLSLKMKLSQNYWYNSSTVVQVEDGFSVLVLVKYLDNKIRKMISPVINGVSVKTEVG